MKRKSLLSMKNILAGLTLILSVLSLAGMTYLTRFAMQAKAAPGGQRCVQMNQEQMHVARLTMLLVWATLVVSLVSGASFLYFFSDSLKTAKVSIKKFADQIPHPRTMTTVGAMMFIIAVLELFAFGYLTRFAFQAKNVGGGLMCVAMNENEANVTKVGVTTMWIGLGLSVIQAVLSLVA